MTHHRAPLWAATGGAADPISNIWSALGVYAVTVVLLSVAVIALWKKLAEKDAIIQQMLPVLSEAQNTMAETTRAASEMVSTVAVLRDRRIREE